MQTPPGTSSISEHTTVRAPLGRTIAIVVAIVGATATASVQYARLSDKVDSHIGNEHVHLNSGYHLSHGQPVGNFDFTVSLGEINRKLDAIDRKSLTTICKRQGAEMVCSPKESQ